MNSLILDKTQDTPGIILDKKSGIFSFEGASIPENVKTFYKPVIEWVEEYTNNVITSYSIHYTKLYETGKAHSTRPHTRRP